MNQKCVGTISKIQDVLEEVSDALESLKAGIQADDEEQVEAAMDTFPTPKKLASALEKLGALIEGRPWEKRK